MLRIPLDQHFQKEGQDQLPCNQHARSFCRVCVSRNLSAPLALHLPAVTPAARKTRGTNEGKALQLQVHATARLSWPGPGDDKGNSCWMQGIDALPDWLHSVSAGSLPGICDNSGVR